MEIWEGIVYITCTLIASIAVFMSTVAIAEAFAKDDKRELP